MSQVEGQPASYALEGSVAVAGLALRSPILLLILYLVLLLLLLLMLLLSFTPNHVPTPARWLRDNMHMIDNYAQAYQLAAEVGRLTPGCLGLAYNLLLGLLVSSR